MPQSTSGYIPAARRIGWWYRQEKGEQFAMMKKLLAVVLCWGLLFAVAPAARALTVEPATDRTFDLPCQAAILIDEDSGTVLYEKNADEQRPVASITKVMTLLLTFEAMEEGRIRADDLVPVSEHAYHMGGSQI